MHLRLLGLAACLLLPLDAYATPDAGSHGEGGPAQACIYDIDCGGGYPGACVKCVNQQCVATCSKDDDCASGQLCAIYPNNPCGNTCVKAICQNDTDCDKCMTCVAGSCQGMALVLCTNDFECDWGQVCQLDPDDACKNVCVAKGEVDAGSQPDAVSDAAAIPPPPDAFEPAPDVPSQEATFPPDLAPDQTTAADAPVGEWQAPDTGADLAQQLDSALDQQAQLDTATQDAGSAETQSQELTQDAVAADATIAGQIVGARADGCSARPGPVGAWPVAGLLVCVGLALSCRRLVRVRVRSGLLDL